MNDKTLLKTVLEDKLYIAQNIVAADIRESFTIFTTAEKFLYFPFCDDFGPLNLGSVLKFVSLLDDKISSSIGKKILYIVDGGRRALSNAGSILKINICVGVVLSNFLSSYSISLRMLSHDQGQSISP